ncbi:MAG: DUF481 domain-containing protein [Schleiferiaceae bacterium]|jgi:hypothetical protein|nr:DUF481 domain-containing protein [Schleiferiaceae bacterium]
MKKFTLLLFTLTISTFIFAQRDSLILNNGDVIVGDFKSMDKGVVTIEPPYSDSDFKIEWEGIKEMYITQRYSITLNDGQRYSGTFTSTDDGKILIKDEDGTERIVDPNQIVYLNSVDDSFSSRLYANIDFGYSLTKANNQQQLNANFRIGYIADMWSLDLYYNSLFTTQDGVEDIRRNDGGIGYRYFLPADWYLSADLTWLSNTEQSLDLRTNGKIGIGNYIIHSNTAYWGLGAGGAFNNEDFGLTSSEGTDSAYNRQSFEGYIGTELNLYDIGDLNLFTNLTAYPSFTESGRWRADFRFDAKYDDFLIKDFYIRLGYTLNYDNRPAEPGKEIDYVLTTGFGWEW